MEVRTRLTSSWSQLLQFGIRNSSQVSQLGNSFFFILPVLLFLAFLSNSTSLHHPITNSSSFPVSHLINYQFLFSLPLRSPHFPFYPHYFHFFTSQFQLHCLPIQVKRLENEEKIRRKIEKSGKLKSTRKCERGEEKCKGEIVKLIQNSSRKRSREGERQKDEKDKNCVLRNLACGWKYYYTTGEDGRRTESGEVRKVEMGEETWKLGNDTLNS